MKYFTNRSQLVRMDFHTRLIMTFFLVFMLLAGAVAILLSSQRTGLSPAGAAAYYRGDEQGMLFPKEPAELLETTHFHLFIMPVVFLTTGHLFLMSAWSSRWKTLVISSCFVYILLDVAKPWLIRYVSATWGMLAPFNSALLGMTLLLCILVPIYEMWFLPQPSKNYRAQEDLE
ncbi:MAG: hypothetical protein HYW07_24540 [Candidatus Latescibacteria bacterium]|nr:hypothetical protein [Candidatus Latescibacterota bacterium]